MAGLGLGSFVKPQATSVRPGDLPSFKDLSMQEKLMMLGATLRGDMQGAQQIPMMAAARARQAQQAGLDQEFGRYLSGEGIPTLTRRDRPAIAEAPEPELDPQQGAASDVLARLGGMEGVPTKRPTVNVDVPQFGVESGERRAGPPTLRDALPLLMRRRAAGIDIKTDIDLLDKAGPDIKYERGIRYDGRDPSSAPREIIDVDKGQQRVFDASGNVVGVMNANGYVQSVADLERAKTEATEGAKAGWDVGVYEDADGIPRRMTRARAVGALNGVPMLGGGQPAPSGVRAPVSASDISRGQSPADKIRAEGRAKTDVDIEAMTPKAMSTLETLDRKTRFVLDTLRKAKKQATGGLGGGAGLNSIMSFLPETAAYDFRSTLDTIEANVGFDELQQMRDNSPTGGAVGSLTERELALLSSLKGSLKPGQSPPELSKNIDRMIAELEKVSTERRSAFQRQYGANRPRGAGSGGGSRITPDQARAELARRRAAGQ
jgi:hypothetical protein